MALGINYMSKNKGNKAENKILIILLQPLSSYNNMKNARIDKCARVEKRCLKILKKRESFCWFLFMKMTKLNILKLFRKIKIN